MKSILRFVHDTTAAVAVQVALTATVCIVFVGLAIELGEAFALNTELQEAADSAALSAAAELDGFTGAIARATTAATAFGANQERWDVGGPATVQIASETFLSSTACGTPPCTPGSSLLLPPNPSPTGDVATTTDVEAGYVRVVTKTNSVAANLASLLTGRSLIKTEAVATAGRNPVVCLDVPLMICNPNEIDGNGDLPPTLVPGQEILVSYNGGSMIAPGNWGSLCPPSDPNCGSGGANGSGAWLASASSTASQCNSAIMSTSPGVAGGPTTTGFNARFGQKPAPAGAQIAFNTVAYPPDPALSDNGTRISAGTTSSWDPAAAGGYWATYHSGVSYPPTTLAKNGPGNTPTRFDVYSWENSTGVSTTDPPYSIPAGNYNSGGTQTIATNTARVMNIGIANCIAENEKGRWHGPGISYFQAFLTAPMTTSDIYLEVIKQYGFGSSGPVHNNVELYR